MTEIRYREVIYAWSRLAILLEVTTHTSTVQVRRLLGETMANVNQSLSLPREVEALKFQLSDTRADASRWRD